MPRPMRSGRHSIGQLVGAGHTEVVSNVLLDRGAAIDATTDKQETALHWAANGGHTGVVKLLLDRGAAIDATSDKKWTALHWAAHWNNVKLVKVLLDRGAGVDAADRTGQTALHKACLA